MSKIGNTVKGIFEEHQTIASVLAIIISMIGINTWMTGDIRADNRETNAQIRETNRRIDELFHYVLTGKSMKAEK